jgi:hypothetical protein
MSYLWNITVCEIFTAKTNSTIETTVCLSNNSEISSVKKNDIHKFRAIFSDLD